MGEAAEQQAIDQSWPRWWGNALSPWKLRYHCGASSTFLKLESRMMTGRVVLVVQLPQWYCHGDDTLGGKRVATSAEIGVVGARLMEKRPNLAQSVWALRARLNKSFGSLGSLQHGKWGGFSSLICVSLQTLGRAIPPSASSSASMSDPWV